MRLTTRSVPIVLFTVVLLSFGIYILWFGFYGDDWLYIYNYHLLGANSFNAFVAADRPFSGWVYSLTTPFFRETPLPYHLLMLVLRWMSAVLLWWVLSIIWPEQNRKVAWVAMLFAIYPGFLQNPIAVQYILHFSVLDLLLVSLGTMLLAVTRPKYFWMWMTISVLTALVMFSMEYFVGLELLRPLLLWLVLRRQPEMQGRKLYKRIAAIWSPFLLMAFIFLIWRVFIFKFPTYQPGLLNGFRSAPVSTLIFLFKRILMDLNGVFYGSWRQTLILPGSVWPWLLMVVAFGVVLFFMLRLQQGLDEAQNETLKAWWEKWSVQAVFLGFYAWMVSGGPLWVANVPLENIYPWDRSILPFMVGASLMIVGFVDLIFRPSLQPVVLAGLVALSVGLHFRNAQVYRQEWENLRAYFWQMSWRAPQLAPGTIIVSDAIPLYRFSDNDLIPLLNWTYAPGQEATQMPYQYFDLSLRLGKGKDIPVVKKGLPVHHSYRNIDFDGNTSAILAVYNHDSSCLRFLGPQDKSLPGLPETVRQILPISNLAQVQPDPSQPAFPPSALGSEPPHTWCYYFEKADLERQKGNWLQVTALAEQAFAQGYHPQDVSELLPIIEAYLHQGKFIQASELSAQVNSQVLLRPLLCGLWTKSVNSKNLTQEQQTEFKANVIALDCSS